LSCHEDKTTRKSSVQSIEFGDEVAVKTVEAVGECLAVVSILGEMAHIERVIPRKYLRYVKADVTPVAYVVSNIAGRV
jgi:hypothetical protein